MCHCHDLGDFDFFRDEDLLYRRVHRDHIKDGKVRAAHCPTKQWKEGLSCDWSVIATPWQAAKESPGHILEISVGQCRSLRIDVRYAPVVDVHHLDYNLAHCLLLLPRDIATKIEIAALRDEFLGVAVCRLVESEPGRKWYQRVHAWLRLIFRVWRK